jgi:hypothetical protein
MDSLTSLLLDSNVYSRIYNSPGLVTMGSRRQAASAPVNEAINAVIVNIVAIGTYLLRMPHASTSPSTPTVTTTMGLSSASTAYLGGGSSSSTSVSQRPTCEIGAATSCGSSTSGSASSTSMVYTSTTTTTTLSNSSPSSCTRPCPVAWPLGHRCGQGRYGGTNSSVLIGHLAPLVEAVTTAVMIDHEKSG